MDQNAYGAVLFATPQPRRSPLKTPAPTTPQSATVPRISPPGQLSQESPWQLPPLPAPPPTSAPSASQRRQRLPLPLCPPLTHTPVPSTLFQEPSRNSTKPETTSCIFAHTGIPSRLHPAFRTSDERFLPPRLRWAGGVAMTGLMNGVAKVKRSDGAQSGAMTQESGCRRLTQLLVVRHSR